MSAISIFVKSVSVVEPIANLSGSQSSNPAMRHSSTISANSLILSPS